MTEINQFGAVVFRGKEYPAHWEIYPYFYDEDVDIPEWTIIGFAHQLSERDPHTKLFYRDGDISQLTPERQKVIAAREQEQDEKSTKWNGEYSKHKKKKKRNR